MPVLRGNVCENAALGKSGKVRLHWSFPVVSNSHSYSNELFEKNKKETSRPSEQ
jgi:hypothetical protein